jgi:hypothetical protein
LDLIIASAGLLGRLTVNPDILLEDRVNLIKERTYVNDKHI